MGEHFENVIPILTGYRMANWQCWPLFTTMGDSFGKSNGRAYQIEEFFSSKFPIILFLSIDTHFQKPIKCVRNQP